MGAHADSMMSCAREFSAIPLGEAAAQQIRAVTGQAYHVDGDFQGKNCPWPRGQGRLKARPGARPKAFGPLTDHRPLDPHGGSHIGVGVPVASRGIISPWHTNPAAIVVDCCQRSKIACSSGDSTIR
jgi:hypothetical protein